MYDGAKTMREQRPQIGVQIANARFLRLVMANDRQQVWTGKGWSHRRSDPMLYADIEVVRQDVRNLKRRLREAGDKQGIRLIASQAEAAGLWKGTSADIGSYIDQWWYLSAEVPWGYCYRCASPIVAYLSR